MARIMAARERTFLRNARSRRSPIDEERGTGHRLILPLSPYEITYGMSASQREEVLGASGSHIGTLGDA